MNELQNGGSTSGFSKGFRVTLTLIAAILVIAGGLFPVLWTRPTRCGGNSVAAEADQVCMALNYYLDDYRQWPATLTGRTFYTTDEATINVLSGRNTNANPRGFQYLDLAPEQMELRDPYGNLYNIKLDNDYDQRITLGGEQHKARALVWSNGKDGINNFGRGDDITSWQNLWE